MHKSSHMDHRIEVVFFDPENPRALANLLPDPFVRQVKNLMEGPDANLVGLSETDFGKAAAARGKSLGTLDYNLRMRFWAEYTRVLADPDCRTHMSVAYVTGRKLQKEAFYRNILTDPLRLAYILTPVAGYAEQVTALLSKANEKLGEILELPYRNPDGSINMQIVNKFLQIQESLKKEELRLIYKQPKAQRGRDEPEVEAPTPEIKKAETREQKIARIRELEARANAIPGQVV